MTSRTRFETLDAWRGISACLIVFFHFNNDVYSHFADIRLIKNSYIFVDFFFVLSGFVITASYQEKLLQGLPLKDYIFLRLGRIYPLHLFTLLLFVAFECTKFFVQSKTAPFSLESSNLETLIANIFLVHSLGIFDATSWNSPSWSISVEFYTYVLYAIALLVFRKKIWIPAAIMVVVAPFLFIALGKERMDITYDFGFLRCVYGFSAGILSYRFYRLLPHLKLYRFQYYTLLEILTVIGIIGFVILFANNQISFWSPVLFALSVVVFSLQRGAVSRFLLIRPFLMLGMLSYSIYLLHRFIQLVAVNTGKIMDQKFGFEMFHPTLLSDQGFQLIGVTKWQGDLWQLGTFAVVLAGAFLTYHLIENPCNRWARRYLQKREHQNLPQAASAAF